MIFEKPSNDIFASGAKSGESVDFPDVARGWGVTENTGFIPPMEYFNGAFNRIDKALMYLRQRGISEWDSTIEYPVGAIIQYENKAYRCLQQNTNQNPKSMTEYWSLFGEAPKISEATEGTAGIIKIKNSINGNAEDMAVTEKAVKDFVLGATQKQQNGYMKLPNEMIMQWGYKEVGSSMLLKDIVVTFPIAFPNMCLSVVISGKALNTNGNMNGGFFVVSFDKTAATCILDNFAASYDGIKGFYFMAIGY